MYIWCSINTDVSSVRRCILSALVDRKNNVQCYVAIRATVEPLGVFTVFTLSPEASSGPLPVRHIHVAQRCCGLLLWHDIRERLVFVDTKSLTPGDITSGLLLHHTAPTFQYRNAGATRSNERIRCTDSVQFEVITQYLISEWG